MSQVAAEINAMISKPSDCPAGPCVFLETVVLLVLQIFMNALDDPLIPPCLWQPIREFAATNEHFGFVLTKHGGHLGFLEGNGIVPNSVTWLDRCIVELANAAVVVYGDDNE